MEHISKTIKKRPFANLLDEWKVQYKDKSVLNNIKVEQLWVKKKISAREWNNHYGQISAYYFLVKKENDIEVGFMVANPIINEKLKYPIGTCPNNCELLTNDEVLRVDHYRRAIRMMPYPVN